MDGGQFFVEEFDIPLKGLARSLLNVGQAKFIPVEILNSPSIKIGEPQTVNCIVAGDNWMTPVVRYLRDGVLPEDKKISRLLRLNAACYTLYDDQLYKKGFPPHS